MSGALSPTSEAECAVLRCCRDQKVAPARAQDALRHLRLAALRPADRAAHLEQCASIILREEGTR